ncbi:MAG: hypothetical protein ABG776_10945 [Cyanobacteria bacterium J06555_13]
MILEWPHPQIDKDWDAGDHQWREITPLAYCELKQLPLLHEAEEAFMQSEPVDILPSGEGLYVCCRKSAGFFFARLLSGNDWWELEQLPLPVVKAFF